MLLRIALMAVVLLISGCGGGSGGLDLGRTPIDAGSLVVSIDESSFPTLRRSLRVDPLEAVPGNTTRYRIHVRHPVTGADLIPPIEIERVPGQSVQKVTLTGVPLGPVVVVVIALSSSGQVLATATAEATVQKTDAPTEIPVRPESNPPTIEAVIPSAGPLSGGTSLLITGNHFQGAVSAFIDGLAATQVTVSNDHKQILCLTPAGLGAGAKDLKVISSLKGEVTAAGAFTYTTPATVESVSPAEGPISGGTVITVTGTGFLGTVTLALGTQAVTFTSQTATTLTAVTPPGLAAGPVSVTVTSSVHGPAVLANAFTYNQAPAITSIDPATGSLAGGTSVVLVGTGFQGNMSVTLEGRAATITAQSPTQLTFLTPAGASAGAADVTVTSSQNGSVTLADAFTYFEPPTIASLSATSGPLSGGTLTTIQGTGFTGTLTVTVGGQPATIVLGTTTAITCTTPAAASADTVDVVVNSSTRGSVTAFDSFTYNPLPTLTSVTPNEVPLAGGTTVVIAGTGFGGSLGLTIGGTAAAILSSTTTRITATAPPGAAAADAPIAVTSTTHGNAGGTNLFRYNAAPTVGSVSPASGPLAGGNVILITGSGFGGSLSVNVGGSNASILASTTTSITCTAPARALAATVGVTVTSSTNGSVTASSAYTYNPAPALVSVSPGNGPITGGGPVLVTGTNFSGALSLLIGGQNAPILFSDSTSISSAVPATTSAGIVEVRVVSSSHGSASNPSGYTYNPQPVISSLSPASGRLGGGDTIGIIGSGFGGTLSVTIDGNPATILGSTTTSISITTPAGSIPDDVDVVVTSSTNGTRTLPDGFTYNSPPTLTSATPAQGPRAGGTTVALGGSGFGGALTVSFDGNAATILASTTSIITCTAPASGVTGNVSVTVTSSTHGSVTEPSLFLYNPDLTLGTVVPGSGLLAGGTPIAITGTNLTGSLTVTIGGNAASAVSSSGTTITCTTPAGSASGAVNVVVASDTHGVTTLTSGFTYNPLPAVTSVSPPSGPLAGGNVIVITGANYVGSLSVAIAGNNAPIITSDSTRITCTVPAGSFYGASEVRVTSSTHGQGVNPVGYTYNTEPAVLTVTPPTGNLAGGYPLLIQGTGFSGTLGVTVDGVAATILGSTTTSITVTCPAGSVSTAVNVSVNSSTNGIGTLTDGFTYNLLPTITAVNPDQGPQAGTYPALITGTNFQGTLNVTFGNQAASILASDTSTISCTVPPGLATGPTTLTVASSTHGIVNGSFTYNPLPTIGTIVPNDGALAGGTVIAINGSGYGGTLTVLVDGQLASINSSTTGTITCTTPAGAAVGPVNVQVSSTTHGSVTSTGGFTYRLPDVTATDPFEGPIQGGTVILLTGTGFGGSMTVSVDGRNATVTAADTTHVTCTIPPGTILGDRPLVVTSSLFGTQSYPTGWTYYTWRGEVVASRRSNGTLALSADAAIATTGSVGVAYLDGEPGAGTLNYASRVGTTWTTEPAVVSFQSSPMTSGAVIAIGPSDITAIGATAGVRKPVVADHPYPGNFTVTSPREFDTFFGGDHMTLSLGSDGLPRTAYYYDNDGVTEFDDLEFATQQAGGAWLVDTVDITVDSVEGTSMVLNGSDVPHIAYDTGSQLKYATMPAATWNLEVITSGFVQCPPALTLGPGGVPLVGYANGVDLLLAKRVGPGAWSQQTVTSASLQNVAIGRSATETFLAYQHGADPHPLELARRSDNGSAWNIETVLGDWSLDPGQGSSEIALVVTASDESAILCYQTGFGRLLTYVRREYTSFNQVPTATTTSTVDYFAGSDLVLTGSATDGDGDPLFYEWVQVSGPEFVGITDPFNPTATVTLNTTGTYEFDLRATDGTDIDAARATINVT